MFRYKCVLRCSALRRRIHTLPPRYRVSVTSVTAVHRRVRVNMQTHRAHVTDTSSTSAAHCVRQCRTCGGSSGLTVTHAVGSTLHQRPTGRHAWARNIPEQTTAPQPRPASTAAPLILCRGLEVVLAVFSCVRAVTAGFLEAFNLLLALPLAGSELRSRQQERALSLPRLLPHPRALALPRRLLLSLPLALPLPLGLPLPLPLPLPRPLLLSLVASPRSAPGAMLASSQHPLQPPKKVAPGYPRQNLLPRLPHQPHTHMRAGPVCASGHNTHITHAYIHTSRTHKCGPLRTYALERPSVLPLSSTLAP